VSKHQALGKRRVRIHPERNEVPADWIGEINFAHGLKRVSLATCDELGTMP